MRAEDHAGQRPRHVAAGLRFAVVLLGMAAIAPAAAATYGCVGSDGRKTFSDRPCPGDAADASRRSAGAQGYAAPRHGLTYGIEPMADGTVDARCDAGPAPSERPRQGACDAQRGDTACSRVLPVLCFKAGTRRGRAPASVDPVTGRITWPRAADGPMLGASVAQRGDSLVSPQSGTQACLAALGSGWRMASEDDSASWAPQAQRHASLDRSAGRLWVAAAEAPANCWHEPPSEAAVLPPRAAAEGGERALVGDLLKLRSGPEYARLSPACKQGYDKLEQTLRQGGEAASSNEASLAPWLEWLQQCGTPAAATR